MIPTLLPESEYFSKNDDDFETFFISFFDALYMYVYIQALFMPSDYLIQQ